MPICPGSYLLERTKKKIKMYALWKKAKACAYAQGKIDFLENLGSVAVLVVEDTFGKKVC